MDTVDEKKLEYFRNAIDYMRQDGITIEPGLADDEVHAAEQRYNFQFPPDLRAFLQIGLPVSEHYWQASSGHWITGFPNWREPSDQAHDHIEFYMNVYLLDGIHFDVRFNQLWLDEWGQKSEDMNEACQIATTALSKAPRLVQIYGHRYIPCEPSSSNNPVFSVVQTDIIHYGYDLASYLHADFHLPLLPDWVAKAPRYIPFWSDFDPGHPVRNDE